MDTEVDVLSQMVQKLLDLSRIESGKVPLRLARTDVVEVVTPPIESLRPQAERARQVIANLVHNAIKFTPAGGRVIVEVEPAGEDVVFAVWDTGVGIPADDLPRILERFYKTDRARSGSGIDLGLR